MKVAGLFKAVHVLLPHVVLVHLNDLTVVFLIRHLVANMVDCQPVRGIKLGVLSADFYVEIICNFKYCTYNSRKTFHLDERSPSWHLGASFKVSPCFHRK